ncbi:MAG: phage protein Gp36 family protein [bacterium]
MYASLQELQSRLEPALLVDLADDDGDGQADDAVIAAALADADAEIDARLAPFYAVPLAAPSPLVVRLSADLALERLFERRRREIPPAEKIRFERARTLLGALSSGEVLLSASGISPRIQSQSTTADDEKLFSRDELQDF